ncbi:dethiobiotin synthase [Verrucomicrobiales bacterium BCK34]|nr:dethiobiotin synthase [Verrucomicrobiales bacterium BCK34]
MSKAIFITGTDTDVGKTHLAVELIRALRESGQDAIGMKPIECGGNTDSTALHEASRRADLTLQEVNPVSFPQPLAPAAMKADGRVSFSALKSAADSLCDRSDFVVIEGAGGWLVPVDGERSMEDLAIALGFPVLIVSANRLGVLNHTLLTLRAIEAAGLTCAGIYLNTIPGQSDLSSETNAEVLCSQLPALPVFDNDVAALTGHLLKPNRVDSPT